MTRTQAGGAAESKGRVGKGSSGGCRGGGGAGAAGRRERRPGVGGGGVAEEGLSMTRRTAAPGWRGLGLGGPRDPALCREPNGKAATLGQYFI